MGAIKSERIKIQGSIPPQSPLAREWFLGLLTKSARPLKPNLKETGTSESHLSAGYSDSIDWQIQFENILQLKKLNKVVKIYI